MSRVSSDFRIYGSSRLVAPAFLVLLAGLLTAEEPHWRSGGRCGVNVVYAFLRIVGVDVDYSSVVEKVPAGPNKGSSLQSLADALRHFGVRAQTSKTNLHGLKHLELPLIAHLEIDNPSTGGAGQIGHYVLLAEITDRRVRYLDGSSGQFMDTSLDYFLTHWTGYIVYRSAQLQWYWIAASGLAGASFVLICFAIFRSIFRIRRAPIV